MKVILLSLLLSVAAIGPDLSDACPSAAEAFNYVDLNKTEVTEYVASRSC